MSGAVRRALSSSGLMVATVLALAFLLLLASQSTAMAFAAILLAGFGLVIIWADLTRTGTMLMIVGMFLAPLNDFRVGTSQVTISDLVYVVAIGLLLPTVFSNKLHFPPMFILGLGILFTTGVIASITSPIPIVSFSAVFRLIVGAFALPIFFMLWRPPREVVTKFAAAYVLGTVFSVVYGVFSGAVAGDARYVGYTTHPNFFGLSCLLAVSLVPFVLGTVRRQYQWIFWGAALICAYGVWISGSRAALLVLGVLVVVYPLIERSIYAGLAVIAVIGIGLAFSGRLLEDDSNSALGRLFGNGTASGSDIARRELLDTAIKQIHDHPILGNGFDGGIGAHNIYLQVLVAVGIFGFLGYLMLLWTTLRPLFWSGINHRLAYPVLAYMGFGPLTNTLWERLIWSAVGLTFALNIKPPNPDEVDEPEPASLVDEAPRPQAIRR